MRRVLDKDWLTLFSRLLIGGVFIYASFYKIIEPAGFAKSIWYYHIMPGSTINLLALVLPWLELVCGVAVIVGWQYRGAAAWLNIMLIIFIVALASTIVRGLDIDCGCFKAAQSATAPAWRSLLLDAGLLVFGIQMCVSRSIRWRLGSSS
jgi:uncharacterized membrane protein YphA (DoxX/SURF4 family)